MANGPSAAEIEAGNPNCRLETAVAVAERWPTPRANSAMAATFTAEAIEARRSKSNLEEEVQQKPGMWPTLRASKAMSDVITEGADPDRYPNLETVVKKRDPSVVGGALNPPWVEWLMGFPLGWTDLDHSATPSCPK